MSRRPLRSILYVDDEPDIREIVELSLGLAADLEVASCGSGEEALALLANSRPDLVLLDVMMPGLDGPGTLARMRADPGLAGIPVVFLTAKALPAEVQRFLALGAAAIIPKPFDALKLADQVKTLWEGLPHAG
jgi:two-component system OmpR family response regulator